MPDTVSKVILNGNTLMDATNNTATSSNMLSGVLAQGADGADVTGNIASVSHPNPTASVNSSTGLVTASHTQSTGYVTGSTTTGTLQLTTQAAASITPTKSQQTAVSAGKYTTGAVTVAAIPAQYITTTDATATADQIYSGATAYVNGTKLTGTAAVTVDGHRLIMPSGLISV